MPNLNTLCQNLTSACYCAVSKQLTTRARFTIMDCTRRQDPFPIPFPVSTLGNRNGIILAKFAVTKRSRGNFALA